MMKKKLIIFIDCGDTLVDESTQIMSENGDVLRADMIPGAREMLTGLYEKGHRICLVADGRVASFKNIFNELGLSHIFEKWVISEEVGAEKPDSAMFEAALSRMGLSAADGNRIVMIGNNVKRDILGANRMGLVSILLKFSPRYNMQPETREETPAYEVTMPEELTGLLARLEEQVCTIG
jgi:putative hydrolase of the HAD superfamily